MAKAIPQQTGLPVTTNMFLGGTFDAVNGYYSKQWSSNSFGAPVKDHGHYYQLQTRVPEHSRNSKFSCAPCNRNFFSHAQYKKHVDEHIKCPFPECSLSANIKVIDQHISHQHMLVNFDALQVDDEKWIAERKKRFPTLQRAELRRAEQLERLKRGARIGLERKTLSKSGYKSKGNFKNYHKKPDSEDTTAQCSEENDKSRHKKYKKNKSLTERREEHEKNSAEIDLFDSDAEAKMGIPAFKGMTEFFESTGELSLFGIKNSQQIQDINLDISDEEDDGRCSLPNVIEEVNCSNNALGLLMGNYNSDSENESDVEEQSLTSRPVMDVITCSAGEAAGLTSGDNCSKTPVEMGNCDSDSVKQNGFAFPKRRHKRSHKKNIDNLVKTNSNNNKQKFKLNNKRRRRQTLLERLLEPDIKRERNMILQCIRYIVNENCFHDTVIKKQTIDSDDNFN